MAKKAEREIERWVTVRGVHVPVYKGESEADVKFRVDKTIDGDKKQGKIETKKETKSTQVSDKAKKVADQARKSLSFDKGYAEITGNHWSYAKMSNDEVVKALNATDTKYTYELKHEQTKGAFMAPNAIVNHVRIYRRKK